MAPPSPSLNNMLIQAVRRRAAEEVRTLLADGALPDAKDGETGLTPLTLAAGIGSEEIVRDLLAFGARVNSLDDRAGASPLHKACQGGHLDVVKALVESEAWINVQAATTGHTPLVEAIWFKSDAIVEYLLDRDARIELNTYYGFTIDNHIDYAINVNRGRDGLTRLNRIRELLAQRRARDVERRNRGALISAVRDKDLSSVKAAIAGGSDLEQRYPVTGSFDDGHTPLLIAARDGLEEIVAELIAAGADVNAIEPVFGAVPLHKATYHGYVGITRLLAGSPAVNLDYQGPSNGYTPLHDALWHGYAECARVLLNAGARTDIVAYDGKLPLDIAIEELGENDPVVLELERSSGRLRNT